MNNKIILSAIAIIGLVLSFQMIRTNNEQSLGLAACTPTESIVTIGHQETRTILPAGARSWAIIQQPANASNTASLSIGGTAVAGRGYQLFASSSLSLGFATDYPTSAAVTGRTSAASSTLHVVVCR